MGEIVFKNLNFISKVEDRACATINYYPVQTKKLIILDYSLQNDHIIEEKKQQQHQFYRLSRLGRTYWINWTIFSVPTSLRHQ